ncbi:MAG: hypothetical protein ACLSDQ_10670 [Adlercreutzia equolifaciens]
MILGDTKVYTTCWMAMVPTSAMTAHGLMKMPTMAGAPSHGPMMGTVQQAGDATKAA